MENEKVRIGKKYSVKVITGSNQRNFISHQDADVAATGMSNENAAKFVDQSRCNFQMSLSSSKICEIPS